MAAEHLEALPPASPACARARQASARASPSAGAASSALGGERGQRRPYRRRRRVECDRRVADARRHTDEAVVLGQKQRAAQLVERRARVGDHGVELAGEEAARAVASSASVACRRAQPLDGARHRAGDVDAAGDETAAAAPVDCRRRARPAPVAGAAALRLERGDERMHGAVVERTERERRRVDGPRGARDQHHARLRPRAHERTGERGQGRRRARRQRVGVVEDEGDGSGLDEARQLVGDGVVVRNRPPPAERPRRQLEHITQRADLGDRQDERRRQPAGRRFASDDGAHQRRLADARLAVQRDHGVTSDQARQRHRFALAPDNRDPAGRHEPHQCNRYAGARRPPARAGSRASGSGGAGLMPPVCDRGHDQLDTVVHPDGGKDAVQVLLDRPDGEAGGTRDSSFDRPRQTRSTMSALALRQAVAAGEVVGRGRGRGGEQDEVGAGVDRHRPDDEALTVDDELAVRRTGVDGGEQRAEGRGRIVDGAADGAQDAAAAGVAEGHAARLAVPDDEREIDELERVVGQRRGRIETRSHDGSVRARAAARIIHRRSQVALSPA